MANLSSSPVRSPMATPCSWRTYCWMAASMSKPPHRMAWEATTPPREITAVSVVPPPDVDHHVAHRLVDVESGPDGRGHGLLDQMGGRRTGPPGRLLHRPALHGGDGRRHADEHPGPVQLGDPGPSEQQPDHPLGDVEVGDGPLPQGSDRHDVPGRPPDHLPRLVPDGQDLVGPGVEGDHRRLVQDDAHTLGVDQGVGRPEIDRQVPSHAVIVGPVAHPRFATHPGEAAGSPGRRRGDAPRAPPH